MGLESVAENSECQWWVAIEWMGKGMGKVTKKSQTRKAQLTQSGTHDSDACVKTWCEQNLSSQQCFT